LPYVRCALERALSSQNTSWTLTQIVNQSAYLFGDPDDERKRRVDSLFRSTPIIKEVAEIDLCATSNRPGLLKKGFAKKLHMTAE
jgi:hypothetical protein